MLRGVALAPVLLLAVSIFWSAPAWSHPALEVATDVATATPASTLAWSTAPAPPAVPWPAILGAAAVLAVARRRPRRAMALAIVLILAVFAFENGVHSVHHLNQVRHLDDLRSASMCPVAAATAQLAGTPVDGAIDERPMPASAERVVVQQLLRLDSSCLAVLQGRAPPLSA